MSDADLGTTLSLSPQLDDASNRLHLLYRTSPSTDGVDLASLLDRPTTQRPRTRRRALPAPLPWERGRRGHGRERLPRPGEVPAARLHELNQQALDYYRSLYPHSWGPDYLRHRLGTDLTDHPHYAVGYAPGSGQSLIRHLTTLGATLDELDQAGLVSPRDATTAPPTTATPSATA